MTSSEKIRLLCTKMNISIAELARKTNQSPQNLNGKLKRNSITEEEFIQISEILGIEYEQAFILPNGEKMIFKSGGIENEFKY